MANGNQRCVLTNAHSVAYHTQVRVKKRGDERKFIAKVLSIGTDCDVALLAVEDEEFWQGMVPLEFGPLPKLQVRLNPLLPSPTGTFVLKPWLPSSCRVVSGLQRFACMRALTSVRYVCMRVCMRCLPVCLPAPRTLWRWLGTP